MARVGVDELPSELTSQTNRPIMFAYRYLTPQSHVGFQVVKHEQIGVMEAVAETAFYEVLVSDGQSMHRVMVNLQNSRKQYLEVRGVPANARVWSLVVNSKPAKPVRGDGDSLLVPLLESGGGSNEGARATSVELAYLVQREELGGEGSLELAPPRLDVPISVLQVEVQWPESHEVTFGGSARSVRTFAHALPKPVNHDVGTDMVPRHYDFRRAPPVRGAGVNAQVPNLPPQARSIDSSSSWWLMGALLSWPLTGDQRRHRRSQRGASPTFSIALDPPWASPLRSERLSWPIA